MKSTIKKALYCLVICLVLLLLLIYTLHQFEPPVSSPNFYELTGLKREQIITTYAQHNDIKIPLDNDVQTRILDSLDLATPSEALTTEPFTPSDYSLVFETDAGEYQPFICWFSGRSYDAADYHFTGYHDRRFDVCVNGIWYVFRQDETVYWNDHLTELSFYTMAQRNHIALPKQYELDGYDGEPKSFDAHTAAPTYQIEQLTAQQVIGEADLVILASFEGYEEIDQDKRICRVSRVHIEEVIKGDVLPETLLVDLGTKVETISHKRYVTYSFREAPDLKTDDLYLLCLKKEAVDGVYKPTSEIYATGVVLDDTIYPRFNTEIHPLYQQPLALIRQYAALASLND